MTRYIVLALVTILLALSGPGHAEERRDYPGGWRAVLLPSGQFAVPIGNSHIETDRGRVALPDGQNCLYPDLTADGRIACVGHRDDHAWEWNGGWRQLGLAHGVNAVLYDRAGHLLIATSAVGSQGYRYVDLDGRVWTGDETYADPARHLWERTCLGNVCCGQGGDEETLACLVDGRRVLVDPGLVRDVEMRRAGDVITLGFMLPLRGMSSTLRTSVAELAARPTFAIPGTTPPPPPSPIPPPPPQSAPDWGPFFDYLEQRWRERNVAACAQLGDSQIAECQAEHVHQMVGEWHHQQGHTGFGLLWKPGGSNHHSHSEDWLLEKLADGSVWGLDAVGALGASHAFISRGTPTREPNPQNWRVPPIPNGSAPVPTPPPPTPQPPPSVDLAPRVSALEQQVADLLRRIEEQRQQSEDVRRAIRSDDELKAFVCGLLQQQIDATVSGRTATAGGILGHSHQINPLSVAIGCRP